MHDLNHAGPQTQGEVVLPGRHPTDPHAAFPGPGPDDPAYSLTTRRRRTLVYFDSRGEGSQLVRFV